MITEDYVSFETAKLLKEKGFDYYPDGSYWLIDANNVMYWVSEIGAYDYVDVPTEDYQRPKNGYRLVTQAMAMKWFREVHNIHISIDYSHILDRYRICITKYNPNNISDLNNTLYYSIDYDFSNYEKACEAGIKYCLENLV